MGFLSLAIPQSGLANSTEDPKVANDLTLIQTWANGNIDQSNLSSALQALTIAGSWNALTLGTNVGAAPGYTPSARLESDVVRFKGALKSTGVTPDSVSLATLPVALRPASTVTLAVPIGTSITGSSMTMQPITITSAGLISTANGLGLTSACYVLLDGYTFTTS